MIRHQFSWVRRFYARRRVSV